MKIRFSGRTHLWSVALLGSLFWSACGDEKAELKETPVATPDYASLWTNVLSRCGSCHGVSSNAQTLGGPDLRTQAGAYTALVGVKGSGYPNWGTFQKLREKCLSKSFIEAGSANSSMVIAVLDTTVSLGDCAVVDHQNTGKVSVSAANVKVLKEWIDAGAKP
jgi:hypothetical protein